MLGGDDVRLQTTWNNNILKHISHIHNTMADTTVTPVSKEAAEALVPLFQFERMLNQGRLFLFPDRL